VDATVVCIGQTKNMSILNRVPRGFRRHTTAFALSGQRDWTWSLGTITKDGDRFFSRFDKYVTAEHAKHFIPALCGEFQEDLVVVLDRAPYFRASAVTDLADLTILSSSDYRRTRRN
jgi:transposase-like protein